jgi:DNA-binding transcriptional MerR regulator
MIEKIFSISEVSELLGVPPHVLGYWETEFTELSPEKDGAGRRIYCERDMEIAARIKEMLYDERLTIAETIKRLTGEYQMRDDPRLNRDR